MVIDKCDDIVSSEWNIQILLFLQDERLYVLLMHDFSSCCSVRLATSSLSD